MSEAQKINVSLTSREIFEVKDCLTYALGSNHGTDGHLKANIIAKLAIRLSKYEQLTDGERLIYMPDFLGGIKVVRGEQDGKYGE